MRFCQSDGTPLIDDAPAFDPYATIVGKVMPPSEAASDPTVSDAPEPSSSSPHGDGPIHETASGIPIAPPDDLLEMPQADPLKTMYVADGELEAAMGNNAADDEPEIVDIPPIEENPAPELPKFTEPDVPTPSFATPPPSPFAPASPFDVPPPSPSPFDQPDTAPEQAVPAPPVFDEPEPAAPFAEAETVIQTGFGNPFDTPSAPAPVQEWAPPPAPEPQWQNQDIGINTPFQPPPGGIEGANKGLAIGSLVCGILSCLCCISVITGPVAIILGYLAKKKIVEDPRQYGGAGLAMGGMVTGAIGALIGFGIIIIQLFFGGLGMLLR